MAPSRPRTEDGPRPVGGYGGLMGKSIGISWAQKMDMGQFPINGGRNMKHDGKIIGKLENEGFNEKIIHSMAASHV